MKFQKLLSKITQNRSFIKQTLTQNTLIQSSPMVTSKIMAIILKEKINNLATKINKYPLKLLKINRRDSKFKISIKIVQ